MAHNILVVGGNGFIGSAVCKMALAKGMQVTSISSSGRPYRTPRGHAPAWTSKVQWLSADALNPSSYAHLMPKSTAVVHTLGTLMEDSTYKDALKQGNFTALFSSLAGSITGRGENPLKSGDNSRQGTYERINRDAALRVCETFVSSEKDTPQDDSIPRPFIYISAEDIFRPVIPARYIQTKREAELGIAALLNGRPAYRGVYIRPSLVYHPHLRPLTTPVATLLDLSSTLHRKLPPSFPTPSNILRSVGSALEARSSTPNETSEEDVRLSSPLESMANALTIPPIHVEHVAEAICLAVQREDVQGIVGVKQMRSLIGWHDKSSQSASQGASPGV